MGSKLRQRKHPRNVVIFKKNNFSDAQLLVTAIMVQRKDVHQSVICHKFDLILRFSEPLNTNLLRIQSVLLFFFLPHKVFDSYTYTNSNVPSAIETLMFVLCSPVRQTARNELFTNYIKSHSFFRPINFKNTKRYHNKTYIQID